ncbi:MAG: DUF4147 domain-containing protein [Chloroflexi bacterium]|nr:DUF4147 domain-containing protein [Chloroflexota bacterium]
MRILNMDTLSSHGNVAGRKHVLEILEAGMEAADPYNNTFKLIRVESGKLIVGNPDFEPTGSPRTGEEVFDLAKVGRILVFGAGKGVHRVARAIEEVLGDRLTGGHIVVKRGDEVELKRVGYTYGAHPAPDEGCATGCRRILEMSRGLAENDLVFTVAGSGVSSLMTIPAPGLTIEDLRQTTYVTQIERGVPTSDLSPVRNHIDAIKGGRLARAIQPATAVHILTKDPNMNTAPGETGYHHYTRRNNWLHTLPDYTTFQDAIDMLKKWDAWDAVRDAVRQHLLRADPAQETVKPEEFEKTDFRIFGIMPDKLGLLRSAARKAAELGYTPYIMSESLRAEAREAGQVMASIARNIEDKGGPFQPPCVLISGGELLVTVGQETGVGGRNQEFALSAAMVIAGSKNIVVGAVASAGTDGPGGQFLGEDYPIPNLVGGLVDGETLREARAAGVDVHGELMKHDTTPALWAIKSGILATHNISLNDLGVTLIMGRNENAR